jgi:DNA-binding NtrC family response regulator
MRLNDAPRITIKVGMTLKDIEKVVIEATLKHTWRNVARSARILGIDRSTLYEKIREHKLRLRE